MIRISTFLIVLTAHSALCQVAQRAVLYSGRDQTGDFIIIPQTYAPDLRAQNFDNKAKSACVTGTWIFYINPNYNTAAEGGAEYGFGDQYCFNLATVGGFVSSARFAGSPQDYRTPTFTIFEQDYYQGEEEYTYTDIPNLNLNGRHKSLIITGTSSWTIYDQPNFSGNSLCLFPEPSNTFAPLLIPDLDRFNTPIPHGSIKSVRKGCLGKV